MSKFVNREQCTVMIRRFSLITLWLISLSTTPLLAVKLEGNILFDEATSIAKIILQINSITQNLSANQFSIDLAEANLYQLKIEAEGYYPSVHTFSHYELNELSSNASKQLITVPDITLIKRKDKRVMFAFGGDVMMGRRYAKPYFNEPILIHAESKLADTKSLVEFVKPYMEIADFSAINLETQIADKEPEQRAPKGVTFYSPSETLTALEWAGIDYVTLGNNHIYDYVEQGLLSTLAHLDNSGLGYSGAGINQHQALKAYHTTISNQDYAMLGFVGWEGGVTPNQVAEQDKGGSAFGSMENIINTVAIESKKGNTTIVQYHGSLEYSKEPTGVTESRLKTAIDHGADLVIAHHPHVTQGFELYKGKLIAWSMGNFIFDQYFHTPPLSYVLHVWMDGDDFYRAEIVPIYIKGYAPVPATGIQRNSLSKRTKALSLRRGLKMTESAGHFIITNDQSPTKQQTEVSINIKTGSRVSDFYRFPVTGTLSDVSTEQNKTRYRLGENQLNGGDFESFNLFSSAERSWLLEQASLSNSVSASGSNSIQLSFEKSTKAIVGMKYFRRVYESGSPMTYKAKILNKAEPVKLRLLYQRRKKNDKLFDAMNNNEKHLLEELIVQPGDNWQDIEIDFNSRRVGIKSYRIMLEVTSLVAKQSVFLDDIALIDWQAHYNEPGKLPLDKSLLGFATHIGIEPEQSAVTFKLTFE
jgi:poly-gamma-glutamate capsule biosynthesis protein CapA/YwtB (metallophosphatase superfamily)